MGERLSPAWRADAGITVVFLDPIKDESWGRIEDGGQVPQEFCWWLKPTKYGSTKGCPQVPFAGLRKSDIESRESDAQNMIEMKLGKGVEFKGSRIYKLFLELDQVMWLECDSLLVGGTLGLTVPNYVLQQQRPCFAYNEVQQFCFHCKNISILVGDMGTNMMPLSVTGARENPNISKGEMVIQNPVLQKGQ